MIIDVASGLAVRGYHTSDAAQEWLMFELLLSQLYARSVDVQESLLDDGEWRQP